MSTVLEDRFGQTREIESFLERFSQELNSHGGSDRRCESRQRIVVPVLLMPFTTDGRQAGEAIHGVTRDLSQSGIGLLTTKPIHADKIGLLFETLSGEKLMVALEVKRCRRVGHYYDVGGQFSGAVAGQ